MKARKFAQGELADFVVVGSGAAGGVIARELSVAGFSVVVMEQGPRINAGEFEHDELKYTYLFNVANNPASSPQTFRRSQSAPGVQRPGFNALLYGRLVGGSTTLYTANYWRFHEIDFNERSVLGGIPGTTFADWPISYKDLEPYYTRVDWEIGVSGLAGANPFEPARSKPYPMKPLPVKSSGVLIERGARKLGLHPYPAPMAIVSEPYGGRPACVNCGFCMGFGCEVTAKSSVLYTMIPQAEATGRCEVRSNSYVFRVESDKQGRATGVTYFDSEKRIRFQPARAVVVSANGAETPRLLLNSTSNRFPHGLANSNGVVGKNLMFNQQTAVHGVFAHELNEYKSVQVTRVVQDFYNSDPRRGFYGGGGIDGRLGRHPIGWATIAGGSLPRWGAALKERLEAFPRSMVAAGHGTSLALETNSISLDPTLKDAWGIPALQVTYKDHPDDLANARFLRDRSADILHAAGAQKIWPEEVTEKSLSVHLLGTCRMGRDPAQSVTDAYHRAHDVPNLFICDGSSFVTSGRGQPTMTIQALAFRAADHIARFAKAGEI